MGLYMDRRSRKEVISAYKERKPARGVFAVICGATGETWVGQSGRLDTVKNRLWFALRTGTSPHVTLKAAWTLHGEAAFRFEELDRLRDDLSQIAVTDELKKRLALWQARLGATQI